MDIDLVVVVVEVVRTARFTRCKLAGGIRNLSSRESGIKPTSCFPSKQGIAQHGILLTRDGGWVKNYKTTGSWR